MSTNQLIAAASAVLVIVAWVTFAEHPTARNLRTALLDSAGLL